MVREARMQSKVMRFAVRSSPLLIFLGLLLFVMPANAAPLVFREVYGPQACPTCRWIDAEGEITETSASKLRDHLLANPPFPGETIVINSPGGSLIGGLALGRAIRQAGLSTHLAEVRREDGTTTLVDGGVCASACAYAFLGGVNRSMTAGARYGLHQFYADAPAPVDLRSSTRAVQDLVASLTKYVTDMGVRADIVQLATRTRSDSVYWLEPSDALSYGVVNSSGINPPPRWVFETGTRAGPRVRTTLANGTQEDQSVVCAAPGLPIVWWVNRSLLISKGDEALDYHWRDIEVGFSSEQGELGPFKARLMVEGGGIKFFFNVPFNEMAQFASSSRNLMIKPKLPAPVARLFGEGVVVPEEGRAAGLNRLRLRCDIAG